MLNALIHVDTTTMQSTVYALNQAVFHISCKPEFLHFFAQNTPESVI